MKSLFLVVFTILFTFSFLYSQSLPFKTGKVSEEELNLKECSFFKDAHAMILGEYGDVKFIYDDNDGWKYKVDIAVRKKIFKMTGGNQANVKIKLYVPKYGTNKEEIFSLKANTYNLVGGKIEKVKLDDENVFTTRLNDYWVEVSFAMPKVKAGSVIEYSYTKNSDYLTNLSSWDFQSDIPTAVSDFRYTTPQFFVYQAFQTGKSYEIEQESASRLENFSYKQSSTLSVNGPSTGGASNRNVTSLGSLESDSKWTRIVMKNIPPLEDEPYMVNREDVKSKIRFQLISIEFPNSVAKQMAGSYQKFNNDLLESSSFGLRYKNGNFMKDIEASLQGKRENEKVQIIYNHITNRFSWNNINSFLSSDAGRTAYNKKEGTVADINLTLISALREFGINADPVILSTRGNGTVHPIYPSYEEFNYVIAAIQLESGYVFADASAKLPLNVLPEKCRNGQGYIVTSEGGGWINMKSNSIYEETTLIKMAVNESGINSHVTQKKNGYAAYYTASSITKTSEKEYAASIAKKITDGELVDFKISELSYNKPLTLEYKINQPVDGAEIIYVQPVSTGTILSNPFVRDSRLAPIDFAYNQTYKVIATIEIPEGYIAELPEPSIVKLPNDAGVFSYNASQSGTVINLTSIVNVKKTDFSLGEYDSLKEFYRLVSEKNSEIITLTK